MKIAIIGGTGRQGFGLALRLAASGMEVLIGSRVREKAAEKARELAEKLAARGVEAQERVTGLDNFAAAREAEIVFMTVPYPAGREIAASLKEVLKGKIFVDISVPLKSFNPPEVEMPPEGSAAEEIQALLGEEVRVVGAFKAVSSHALANLERPVESDVLLCGDDPAAKEEVKAVCERLGLRAFDAGGLRSARTTERLAALLIGLNQRYKRRAIGIRLTGT
ncbi:MAG: NADPH-dependent F420 reductase [Candidatus Acetothermia bacterium]|jgi:NADPH-dependent F420 reductase|nr:NADPH-dependent F420 reductase [Candidatus Acetothermia bacterium]MDH7505124.1 NADPH-dependent F420 reductase [Candidatus Acetothermia bacterium]